MRQFLNLWNRQAENPVPPRAAPEVGLVSQLELLTRFSKSVADESNEETLLASFLSTIREAGADFAYLFVSNSAASGNLKLHSWVGIENSEGLLDQISNGFLRQVMSNRLTVTKDHQVMGPSLLRLLGPRARAEDWIVTLIPARQRPGQTLLVAGCRNARFSKPQTEILDSVIAQVGLGLDKIFLLESAQTSNRSKSAFLANMSHEIRTPLNALIGFSEILAGRQLSDSRRMSIAGSVRKNAEYLTRMIDDVLDLSKIEAGKLKIHHRRIRLAEWIGEIRGTIAMKAAEKGLRLEIISTGPVPSHVFVDDLRLKQILLNIAGNAIKFTDRGSVTISLSCRKRAGSSGDLVFYIEDTGVGISPEGQVGLFKPFSQGDDTATRRFGGSGLGLALSSRLATELGGSLKLIRSVKGVGSSFEIVVPTGDLIEATWSEALDIDSISPQVDNDQSVGLRPLDGVRVLLVEDSPDNQEIFNLFLTHAGAEVTLVSDGLAAVEQGLQGSFELILMDIQLPGLDGKEATQRLRASGCMTTIVALTAHAMREEKESCLQAGCDGQISKPVSEKEFISAVRGYLGANAITATSPDPVSIL